MPNCNKRYILLINSTRQPLGISVINSDTFCSHQDSPQYDITPKKQVSGAGSSVFVVGPQFQLSNNTQFNSDPGSAVNIVNLQTQIRKRKGNL